MTRTVSINFHGVDLEVELEIEKASRGHRDKYGQWEPDDPGSVEIIAVEVGNVDIIELIDPRTLDRILENCIEELTEDEE